MLLMDVLHIPPPETIATRLVPNYLEADKDAAKMY